MDYGSLLGGGGGGGGGGYSGEIKTDLKSGGASTAAFGSINFGANAKVGGTSTTAGGEDFGGGSNVLLYVGIGVIALVAMFIFIRR